MMEKGRVLKMPTEPRSVLLVDGTWRPSDEIQRPCHGIRHLSRQPDVRAARIGLQDRLAPKMGAAALRERLLLQPIESTSVAQIFSIFTHKEHAILKKRWCLP